MISGEKFEQPILFGANNLSGLVETNIAYAGAQIWSKAANTPRSICRFAGRCRSSSVDRLLCGYILWIVLHVALISNLPVPNSSLVSLYRSSVAGWHCLRSEPWRLGKTLIHDLRDTNKWMVDFMSFTAIVV